MNLVRLYKLNNLGIDIDSKFQELIEEIDSKLNDLKFVKIRDYSNDFYFNENTCVINHNYNILHKDNEVYNPLYDNIYYNFNYIVPKKNYNISIKSFNDFIIFLMNKKYCLKIYCASTMRDDDIKTLEKQYSYESSKTL